MTDPGYTHPEAYEAIACAAFDRAVNLDRCIHALKHEAIYNTPPGLTPEQIAQRTAILDLACKILVRGHSREMDLAMAHWKTFRRMTS